MFVPECIYKERKAYSHTCPRINNDAMIFILIGEQKKFTIHSDDCLHGKEICCYHIKDVISLE